MKTYLIFLLNAQDKLLKIDHTFVTSMMMGICDKSTKDPVKKRGRPPNVDRIDVWRMFHQLNDEHNPRGEIDPISNKIMSRILGKLAKDILTCYGTNIKHPFVERVKRFVKSTDQKERMETLSKNSTAHISTCAGGFKNNI